MLIQKTDRRLELLDAHGHVLVFGGPGSGKTTIALDKAARRIENGLLPGQAVLFLSFSRAAVVRLLQASKNRISADKLKHLSMHTFHSFCWELLRSHGYLLGAPKKLQILLPHDERVLSGGAKPGSAQWSSWMAERERIFIEEGKTVFDLFIPKAVELVARSSIIRNILVQIYPLVIVDEAQDTGPHAWQLIELLAPYVQVICLADIEQQIFDYIEGVGPERIDQIKRSLKPLIVDLGAQNNRSPGTEINQFATDVLRCRVQQKKYKGVSVIRFHPEKSKEMIRNSVSQIYRIIKEETGEYPHSCALLAPTHLGVNNIVAALNSGDKPIPHKVSFDSTPVILASRIAAFLLEPKTDINYLSDVSMFLQLLAMRNRANGNKSGINQAAKLLQWADQVRTNKCPRSKLVKSVYKLIREVQKVQFSGVPEKDWTKVKKLIQASDDKDIHSLAKDLAYVPAFNRGKRIAAGLSALWETHGSYHGAREVINEVIAEDAMFFGAEDLAGIHVMTIHRSKGKQFDGVIIFRENRRGTHGWESSFVWKGDPYPYYRSRKILRVAITRACVHVLILDPFFPKCPIIGNL